MADRYYLTNRSFETEIERGALTSVKYRKESEPSEFVLPGTLFGELVLSYRFTDGEIISWFCNRSDGYSDSEPERQGRSLRYEWNTADVRGILGTVCEIRLEGEKLEQVYHIKNRSDKPVEILDAAFALTPNSSFEWGDTAGKKVIGHPFIGGHGSHSLITRCDGTGHFLLILPYSTDSSVRQEHVGKWEFFDQGIDLPFYEETKEQRSRLYVYEYSAHEAEAASAHGYRERIAPSSSVINPGEEISVGLVYMWASGYDDARDRFVSFGIPDIITIPGYTVCRGNSVKMRIRYNGTVKLQPEYPEKTSCRLLSEADGSRIFELIFDKLGENSIDVLYGDGRFVRTEFFVTESIRTMIKKRGAFIASHRIDDEKLWYNGLLAEWNNETGVLLSPDNYDRIKGWRIYEVTCDDPGLSKPAFLSGKEAEYPVQSEVDALDRYIEHFVWGGLQCTEEERYPYGIYGIPDWHKNRNSEDKGNGGREHLWRIYDYSHIALMYYNMYRIAAGYSDITTALPAREYLKRACNTAIAMFTLPLELEEWSAYETGLYNELVIPEIVSALETEGMQTEADRLRRHWNRKVKFFVSKCRDLFGSEYPFDTTGFESTHALARTGLELAERKIREDRFNPPIAYSDAVSFLESQMDCNIACRGYLEPAYFWYGSDYRANNHHYTLSYMSQMGGWAVLDYALYFAEDPFPLLRLGYGSILSSWALLNSGDEESCYGFFFPGKEHDGAASGGFEPLPYGKTWLEQPHSSGAWYYSCEIDLGFCGALRAAAAVLAEDPLFGLVLFGGYLKENPDSYEAYCEDGISRRFHIVRPSGRLHVTIDKGHFSDNVSVRISKDFEKVSFTIDTEGLKAGAMIAISAETDKGVLRIHAGEKEYEGNCSIPVNCGIMEIEVIRQKQKE